MALDEATANVDRQTDALIQVCPGEAVGCAAGGLVVAPPAAAALGAQHSPQAGACLARFRVAVPVAEREGNGLVGAGGGAAVHAARRPPPNPAGDCAQDRWVAGWVAIFL